MCKQLILTNVARVKKLPKLVNTARELVTDTEVDGFGYAVQTSAGCFGERTTDVDGFCYSMDHKLLEVDFADGYNRFGIKDKHVAAALFHGRTSTNKRTLLNTHPIVRNGWTLVHNGVVTNQGADYDMITSNDTEHIVHYMSTEGISGVERFLTGYYAFAALDPEGRLHVVRDDTASLYTAHIEDIDSYVFATDRRDIYALCKSMSWDHSVITAVRKNIHLVFKAGTLVSSASISPRGNTVSEAKLAGLSLGRDITPIDSIQPTQVGVYEGEFTEDELAFLQEVNTLGDHTYVALNFRGDQIDWNDFVELDDYEKLCCKVIRPDGTVVDQRDFYTEKLYTG